MGKNVLKQTFVKNLLANNLLNKQFITESRLRRDVLAALAAHAQGVMIDVGCGSKPYEAEILGNTKISRYVGMEYIGAVDYFGTAYQNLELCGDAQRLAFCDEAADVILCSEVLEHLPEPLLAISEAHRILKPGGTYIVTVPSTFKFHMEPHDYHRFTKHGLRYQLSSRGFEVLDLRNRGHAPAALGQAVVSYLHDALVRRSDTGQPSLWRAPLVLPFLALIQGIALLLDQLSRNDLFTVGYIAICRKA